MTNQENKETDGAWIIHHGRKLMCDTSGPSEFPVIDESSKAATLLAKLGETNQAVVTIDAVRAIAASFNVNPRHELTGLLEVLKKKRLVDLSENEVSILGITSRGSLRHAADIFEESFPSEREKASIYLAELASKTPVLKSEAVERVSDLFALTRPEIDGFFSRAEEIGFVDKEGTGGDTLLFNGNLFRRDSVTKTQKVLGSLSSEDQCRLIEIQQRLAAKGCINYNDVSAVLTEDLLKKVLAAGIFDLNVIENESGGYVFVTSPSAFHKYVNPMIDDCFDMAKALVAALTYGMTIRPSRSGRINMLSALLSKLISGREVGPATAIGEDYRVLEFNRVIALRRENNTSMFYMKLLKKDVGELALQVLTRGDATEKSLNYSVPGAPMSNYHGPETNRVQVRKNQSKHSKKYTHDMLEAIRGGRSFS